MQKSERYNNRDNCAYLLDELLNAHDDVFVELDGLHGRLGDVHHLLLTDRRLNLVKRDELNQYNDIKNYKRTSI
jgi:hypothetical protein